MQSLFDVKKFNTLLII